MDRLSQVLPHPNPLPQAGEGVKPVAILGGTFDPVHNAHLRVAWEAAEALDAEVRLIPANIPPHRTPPLATAAERVAILRVALAGQDRLTLDTRELDRDGPSYTVDTLRALRAQFGPARSIVLLLGVDAFAGLPSWHEWPALFDLAHMAVLTRPGHDVVPSPELKAQIASRHTSEISDLREAAAGRVLKLPVTPLEISASAVRVLLATGRDPRWLVPDALFDDPTLLAPYRT